MSTNATVSENTSAPESFCGGMQMPAPTKEHEWMQRFVGEWESEVQMSMAPGQAPMTSKGRNTDRMFGGFWMISEGGNKEMGYQFIHTLGYDPKKKKYIGTWADTMTSYLWKYEGSVNAAGTILTLETEGPSPMNPEKTTKFREVTEFKTDDHRVFTSSALGEDGKWVTFITVTARRVK